MQPSACLLRRHLHTRCFCVRSFPYGLRAPMYPGGVGTLVEVDSASQSLTLSQKCYVRCVRLRLWTRKVHRISIPVVFGIPVSLGPSVELEVAHCSQFLLVRSRAEPESAHSQRVWSMDKTTCPSRSVRALCGFAADYLRCRLFNPRDMVRDPRRTTKSHFLSRLTPILAKSRLPPTSEHLDAFPSSSTGPELPDGFPIFALQCWSL